MGQSEHSKNSVVVDRYVIEAAVNVIFHFQGCIRSMGSDLLPETQAEWVTSSLDTLLDELEKALNDV